MAGKFQPINRDTLHLLPPYGDNSNAIANAFAELIQQQKIEQDIGVSIKQLDAGKGIPIAQAMNDIRSKYE